MNETSNLPRGRKVLGPQRVVLLASAAGLGVALLVAGPSGYLTSSLPAWAAPQHAAENSGAGPASFADLVAKVKPAVVSVRVKVDQAAETMSMNEGDSGAIPFAPGSPM